MPVRVPDASEIQKPRRISGCALGCAGTGVGLVVLLGLYLLWANIVPPLPPEPAVALPNPNGFHAIRAVLPRIQTNPGGAVAGTGDEKTPLAELRPAVAQMKPDLDRLRQALRLPYQSPGYDPNDFQHMAVLRQAARCLVGEARVSFADGKQVAGLNSCLDAVELGAKTQRGGVLIDALVGIAVSSIGVARADRRMGHLSAPEARGLRLRLEAILGEFPSYPDILRGERRYSRIAFRDAARKPPQLGPDLDGEELSWQDRAGRTAVRYLWPKTWANAALERHWDSLLREAEKPLWQRQPLPEPADPYAREFSPIFAASAVAGTRLEANLQLLHLRLALEEFRGKQGRYPAALAQLAPKYLQSLPADPFTGKPLMYRLTPSGYLLYSVGENRIDDGGTPGWTTEGDLVAGRLFRRR